MTVIRPQVKTAEDSKVHTIAYLVRQRVAALLVFGSIVAELILISIG